MTMSIRDKLVGKNVKIVLEDERRRKITIEAPIRHMFLSTKRKLAIARISIEDYIRNISDLSKFCSGVLHYVHIVSITIGDNIANINGDQAFSNSGMELYTDFGLLVGFVDIMISYGDDDNMYIVTVSGDKIGIEAMHLILLR